MQRFQIKSFLANHINLLAAQDQQATNALLGRDEGWHEEPDISSNRYVAGASLRLGPNLKLNQFPASCISLSISREDVWQVDGDEKPATCFGSCLEVDIRSRNTTLTQTEQHLMGRASVKHWFNQPRPWRNVNSRKQIRAKTVGQMPEKTMHKKEATDTQRDYSAYKKCTNNYKPTVAFPLITWSGMPLIGHKTADTS